MNTPTISVIIPVYNTAQTLARCIDSVLAQSFDALEVILVDDGSPDDAPAICDDYAARFAQITVIHQANAGLAEARHSGIRAAQGKYVVHVDSDDTLPPQAVAILYRHAVDQQLDMAYGCFCRIVGEKRSVMRHSTTGVLDGEQFLKHLLSPGCLCGSGGAISLRELWTDDVFPPGDLRLPSEDVFINVLHTQRLRRVGLFNDVVYNYYYNPQSLSISGTFYKQELWEVYFQLLRQHLQSRGLLEEHEQQMRIMEVERLAFSTHDLDTSERWHRQVLSYAATGFPLKTRILQLLLHCPPLLRVCITANRQFKRWFKR